MAIRYEYDKMYNQISIYSKSMFNHQTQRNTYIKLNFDVIDQIIFTLIIFCAVFILRRDTSFSLPDIIEGSRQNVGFTQQISEEEKKSC